MNNDTIKIYVASLSDYNNGHLHGRWIDATQGYDSIMEEIQAMLKESNEPPAEEWAIHDYEGFGPIKLSEYEGIREVADLAELLEEHGDLFAEVVAHVGGTSYMEQAKELMADGYRGEWDSLADYAENMVDECYSECLKDLPDFIKSHIDFEGIGHDLELGGDVFTIEHGHKVHVFDATI